MSKHQLTIEIEVDDALRVKEGWEAPDEWTALDDLVGAFRAGFCQGELTDYKSLDATAADLVREARAQGSMASMSMEEVLDTMPGPARDHLRRVLQREQQATPADAGTLVAGDEDDGDTRGRVLRGDKEY